MKRGNALALGAAGGVVLGGVGWWLARWLTRPRGVEAIDVGDSFPTISAHFLSGKHFTLPDDLHGQPGILIATWDYDARADLSAWRDAVMETYGLLPGVQVFTAALVQDVGTVLQPVVRRLLSKAMPMPEQEHALLVYGDLRALRIQLTAEPTAVPHATVFLIGRDGRLVWRADGQPTPDLLEGLRAALADEGVLESPRE